jgi:hypothetical protein
MSFFSSILPYFTAGNSAVFVISEPAFSGSETEPCVDDGGDILILINVKAYHIMRKIGCIQKAYVPSKA